MRRPFPLALPFVLLAGFLLAAQEEGTLRSGPKEGAMLPGPFDCYNLSGPHKGRFHCLVCRYGLEPTVLVFAREPEEGKDAALTALLKRLGEASEELARHQVHVAAIFLSPDAQSSATNPSEQDPSKLVEEAKKREALYARLAARAENLKGVDVAVLPPAGPKGYDLNPKADVTVVFCHKMRVVFSRGFEAGSLREEDADKILNKVRETLEPAKKT
jgi:hypothetical protein